MKRRALRAAPPFGEQHELCNLALPRLRWIGERDEIGEASRFNSREARARAQDALQAYAARMQSRSPLAWFRESDCVLAWLHPVADPIAVILVLAATPEERARRLVNDETVPVLMEEALARCMAAGDTCAEAPMQRLSRAAQRFLVENVPPEMCPWQLLDEAFQRQEKPAYDQLSHLRARDGRLLTSPQRRGVMDYRLHHRLQAAPAPLDLRVDAPDFTPEQRDVMEAVLLHLRQHGWSLLVGPGGAGKTHMLRRICAAAAKSVVHAPGDGDDCPVCGAEALVSSCKSCGHARERAGPRPLRVAFLAPTNRAVAVLQAAVGGAATFGTLHSACRQRLPQQDLVVVDECSMLAAEHMDLLLGSYSLRAAAWLLVGDHLQLLPVGRGEVLRELLRRARLPALTRNLRARSEDLARLVHAVRSGDAAAALPLQRHSATTLDMLEAIAAAACDLVVCIRNEEKMRYNVFRIQAAPCERRMAALDDFRKADPVGALGNPRAFVPFVGLPVRVETNQFKPTACRGSLGTVAAAHYANRKWSLELRVDDATVRLQSSHFSLPDLLRPAFATTLHDAQGAQRPRVGVVLPPSRTCPLLTLEMLYTAVSRCQEELLIFSCGDRLEHMLERLRAPAPPRLTAFAHLA